MSHEEFENAIFVNYWLVSIKKEGDEEEIFEATSQVEEGAAPRIINTYQDTVRSSRLEGNIKNLPSFLTGGCTINSEDVVDI